MPRFQMVISLEEKKSKKAPTKPLEGKVGAFYTIHTHTGLGGS